MLHRQIAILLLLASSIFFSAGCKVNYSFTGASISPEIKTLSVAYFPAYAPLAQPSLSQLFTESLKDIFIAQTNLELVEAMGDLQFEGEITTYTINPVAITGNETTAQNRLTIGVRVIFTNTKNEEKSFERNFSRYQDFDSSQNLSDVESELNEDIVNQLVQEIFNNSVSDW